MNTPVVLLYANEPLPAGVVLVALSTPLITAGSDTVATALTTISFTAFVTEMFDSVLSTLITGVEVVTIMFDDMCYSLS